MEAAGVVLRQAMLLISASGQAKEAFAVAMLRSPLQRS